MIDLIADHYRPVRELGRGAQGATYLAIDERDGEQVALKELDFAAIGSWDTVTVFEREAAVLGGLNHPGIPRIRESFRVEGEDGLRLFLVQQFVPGDDLQKLLDRGTLFDERRLRGIAAAVLEILVYLHGHSPPVLHRDVKPANLIARPDGTVALVDFGAAQGATRGTVVVGTTGYMPAEQLMGRASPQSDLFALGATLIQLGTRKHPAELGDGLGLRWRHLTNLSPEFADWLDRMVAAMPEDRFASAYAARRALEARGERAAPTMDAHADEELGAVLPWEARVPSGARITLGACSVARRGPRLDVLFDERRLAGPRLRLGGAAYVVVGALGAMAGAALVVVVATMAFALFAAIHTVVPLHKQLIGHPQGLDLVRGGDEVVRRIKLDEIAGPDVVSTLRGPTLVLWHGDGSRTDLARMTWRAGPLRALRDELHAWLIDARRSP